MPLCCCFARRLNGVLLCSQIFEQVLSELEPLCLAEQDFISKYFKLQQHQTVLPPLAQPETEEADGIIQSKIPPQADHRHSLSSDKKVLCNKLA
ncbi:hypothetical protein CHARACLAT_033199 [Characodon lateralis]|uniref:Uncharacterized protein n=1 Tax=Characodon lateralis TaxID=208331 RepID=A0ABU7EEX7_9TELE|nr:hypothetical protein [Characodon lateralis]